MQVTWCNSLSSLCLFHNYDREIKKKKEQGLRKKKKRRQKEKKQIKRAQ